MDIRTVLQRFRKVEPKKPEVPPPQPRSRKPISLSKSNMDSIAKLQALGVQQTKDISEAQALFRKGTGFKDGSPEALRQKANNQDKTQTALSPTDGAKGRSAANDNEPRRFSQTTIQDHKGPTTPSRTPPPPRPSGPSVGSTPGGKGGPGTGGGGRGFSGGGGGGRGR